MPAAGLIEKDLELKHLTQGNIEQNVVHVLDERGKRNWASNVPCKLYQYGSGFVWLNQGLVEMNQFLHVFRERLVVC